MDESVRWRLSGGARKVGVVEYMLLGSNASDKISSDRQLAQGLTLNFTLCECGLMVGRVLVSWCPGVLVSWCPGVLVPWCAGVLVCWCVGVLGWDVDKGWD